MSEKPRPTNTQQIEGPFDSGEPIAENNRFGDYARAHYEPEHKLSGGLSPSQDVPRAHDEGGDPWKNMRTGRGD